MTECIKSYTIRLYTQNDLDLIEKAILNSGCSQSEWVRRSLIQNAEVAVMKGGILGMIYKNVLVIRYLQQLENQHSKDQTDKAKVRASTDFNRVFGIPNKNKGTS